MEEGASKRKGGNNHKRDTNDSSNNNRSINKEITDEVCTQLNKAREKETLIPLGDVRRSRPDGDFVNNM